MTLNLILVSPYLEDVWKDREEFEVEDIRIQVVSKSGLLKMKKTASRPQDLADIAELGLEKKK